MDTTEEACIFWLEKVMFRSVVGVLVYIMMMYNIVFDFIPERRESVFPCL
jgi:hypothetical protein